MNTGRSRDSEHGSPRRPVTPVVHSITGAAQSHSDDMDARIRRYLISMGIRTVCFILVLVIDSPIRWAFAVMAIVLPYVAVVMANAAGGRRRAPMAPVPIARIPLTEGGRTNLSDAESSVRSDASSKRTN